MNCSRCRGLMHAEGFRDWHCGIWADRFRVLRCLVCGEIVDPVIVQNRRNAVNGKVCPSTWRGRRRSLILAVGTQHPSQRRRPVMGRFNG